MTRSIPGKSLFLTDSGRGSLRYFLNHLYGEDISIKTRTFAKLRHKISKSLCTLTFLSRCRDHKVVPNFLKLKHHIKTSSSSNILHKASMSLLRNQIKHTRYELDSISKQLYSLHLELSKVLSCNDWQTFDRITSMQAQRTFELTTSTHIRKFNSLLPKNPVNKPASRRTVVNISTYQLSKDEESILSKGLNFSVAPKIVPTDDIIASVEASVTSLPKATADEIRFETAKCLRSAKPPKPNISRAERYALSNLKSNHSVTILSADKGNATVVMDHSQYTDKVKDLLNDGTYASIAKDPTTKIEREIRSLIKSSDIPPETQKRLIPKESKPPRMYGLPKVHKPGVPLRPIVSTIDSPTYHLSRYLANILKEYTGNSTSHIRNSSHFIELISTIHIDPDDILVSFDVTSLFTKVPINDSVNIIAQLLEQDGKSSSLTLLVEKCLTSTYFTFQGQFYKQLHGAAMGSPLSPVVANIFMEAFESQALESAELKPKVWFRYVDDTFIVWPHGKQTLSVFLDHLNRQHPDILFTMEIEQECALPFLDVLVTRKPDGRLGHSVYRKPTHTDRYLNAASHHHPAQKFSVINSLVHRAVKVSEPDHLPAELNHVRRTLSDNGFRHKDVEKVIKRHLLPTPKVASNDTSTTGNTVAYLPYVYGVTDKIGRILKKENIKTVFKPLAKIKDILPSPKDKFSSLNSKGVYKIPCSCGLVYIGETGRSVKTRLTEHERCIRTGHFSNSAVAEHQLETGHKILFNQASLLCSAPHFRNRKIRESIEIVKHPNNFNRDVGYWIADIWKPVVIGPRQTTNHSAPSHTSNLAPPSFPI